MEDISMLSKKLQIKKGQHILILNQPQGYSELLGPLPEDTTRSHEPGSASHSCDLVQVFVRNSAQLEEYSRTALNALKPGGVLWVSYPKKSSGLNSDLTRDDGWKTLTARGYRGVSQVSIDATWSALRFKPEVQIISKKQDVPEIDLKNRIVTVPDDFKAVLEQEGLLDAFNGMSFTHKKEWVLEIVSAKKSETRQRRIKKAVAAIKK